MTPAYEVDGFDEAASTENPLRTPLASIGTDLLCFTPLRPDFLKCVLFATNLVIEEAFHIPMSTVNAVGTIDRKAAGACRAAIELLTD